MDVGAPLVTNAQTTEGMEPSDGSLNDPAVSAQPLLGFDATPSDTGAEPRLRR